MTGSTALSASSCCDFASLAVDLTAFASPALPALPALPCPVLLRTGDPIPGCFPTFAALLEAFFRGFRGNVRLG
jgi:hypothetical protein